MNGFTYSLLSTHLLPLRILLFWISGLALQRQEVMFLISRLVPTGACRTLVVKCGVGYCKSMPGAVRPFERLRSRLRPAHLWREHEKSSLTSAAASEQWRLPEPTKSFAILAFRPGL